MQWLEEHYEDTCKNLGESHEFGPKPVDLYKRYGLFPIGDTANPGGGAWGWEYHSDEVIEKGFVENPYQWYQNYFELCDRTISEIKKIVDDPSIKVSEAFSTMPSEEPMIPLIEGLACDAGNRVIVNILNDGGYVKGIPTDYEVEVEAVVDKDGVHPIYNKGLPKTIVSHLLRDRIAPVEMELAAFEHHSKEYLIDLIMMDPWTRSRKQAEEFLEDIFDLPCNQDMKEYYR